MRILSSVTSHRFTLALILLAGITYTICAFSVNATMGTGTSVGVDLQTNGATALTVDTNQNVGIGVATPGALLDVNGAASYSAIIVPRNTTANRPTTPANGMIRYNTTKNNFELYANSAWQNDGSGGLINVSAITSTVASWTPQVGTGSMLVECVAGGGGGGGAGGGATNFNAGAGGGGGSYGKLWVSAVAASASYDFNIGASGTAGSTAGGNGGNGGDTTFVAHGGATLMTCKGGSGGIGMAGNTASTLTNGGAGGTGGTGGTVNLDGQPGMMGEGRANGTGLWTSSGNGGNSLLGGGGAGFVTIVSVNTAGGAGGNYGGGGGGAIVQQNATGKAGGAGSPGVCIVHEYR